ncbi:MAG: NosD domain-containing protein [Planctomycetota bacterium]
MEGTKRIGLLLVTAALSLALKIQAVEASVGYIIIDVNGAVRNTDKIVRDVNDYTFVADIDSNGIMVQKSGITIDGDGHTLQGKGKEYGDQHGFQLISYLGVYASNVTIQNTNIRSFYDGIIIDSNSNTIWRNTIADCNTGIDMMGSIAYYDNTFYQNNFINNDVQVRFNEWCIDCNNTWDNGYSSGGNYWDDHGSIDLYNGPDQNILLRDGICDTNCPVEGDANNIDRYPLKKPYLVSVHNTDTGTAYYTIQEAVDDANSGDTLRVLSEAYCEGRYYEQRYYENVNVNKLVRLIGDGTSTTTIDGIRKRSISADDVVEITADNTHIEGFTIRDAGGGKCGLYLNQSEYNQIIGNKIVYNPVGIKLYNSSNYNTIADNVITSNGNGGVGINDSNNILVSENRINSNGDFGVLIEDSDNTQVVDNSLRSNEDGVHIKGDSQRNDISGNKISILSDINLDGYVDWLDLSFFVESWLFYYSLGDFGLIDFDGDDDTDFGDFALFAQDWLEVLDVNSSVVNGILVEGGAYGVGSAYIFKREGTSWSQEAKLTASDGAAGDRFGESACIDGGYAIVGARLDYHAGGSESGSAYIFGPNETDPNWNEQAKLTASDANSYDWFGISVSVDGNYVIVGAHYDDGDRSNSGSAYIFTPNDVDPNNWDQQARLTASDGNVWDLFGKSVSINGNYAIVGAHGDDVNECDLGSAYIFKRDGQSWSQQAKLTASDAAAYDEFGYCVSIDGNYAVVGAVYDDDTNEIDCGSAYIFTPNGVDPNNWDQQAKLTAGDANREDYFGRSVSISGDYAIVGADGDDADVDGASVGSAYVFKRNGTSWTQQVKLTASDGAAGDEFGYCVSIDGNYAIVGAHHDANDGGESGSVYIFKRSDIVNDPNWYEQAKLTASDAGQWDRFGHSVSIDGNYVVVGAVPYSPSYNTITSNEVISHYNGIKLNGSSKNTIRDNVVRDGNSGLWLYNAPGNIIEDNEIKSNSYIGINFFKSDDALITGNEISGNLVGIWPHASYNTRIIGNVLRDDNQQGIQLSLYSSHGIITQNIIMDSNVYGIYLTGGEDNKIYHNAFVNNGTNVSYSLSGYDKFNCWDNGYPSGGNFWDDADFTDNNDDKICDNPYDIYSPYNVDRYPVILVSYEVTTDPIRPEMKEWYDLTVELTNNTNDILPPGQDVNFTGVNQVDAFPSRVAWDSWDLDNILQKGKIEPYSIEPNETKEFELGFKNEWNWIEPHDWQGIFEGLVLSEVAGLVEVGTQYSIACFIESCFYASLAVPRITYIVEPYNYPEDANASPYIKFSSNVRVEVPLEKKICLFESLVAEAAAIVADIAAAICATNPFTAAAAPAFKAAAIAYTAISIVAYYVAEDPPLDYTQITEPNYIPVPYEVNSLPVDSSPEGITRRFALAALELASIEKAYGESYARYDTAKTGDPCSEPNGYYMALQLGAAQRYNAMATSKLQEVQFLAASAFDALLAVDSNIGTITANDVNAYWSDMNAQGLAQIQKDIFAGFDLNDFNDPNEPNATHVKELILAVTAPGKPSALKMRSLCQDPYNMHRFLHLITQAHTIAGHALRATAEEENLEGDIPAHYPNDVAITGVWPSAAQVLRGNEVEMKVEVENHGTTTPTFDVNVYAIDVNGNITTVGANEVNDLAAGETRTLEFAWDTTGESVGYYRIEGEASLTGDSNDSFPADNNYRGRSIKVWLADVNVPSTPVLSPLDVNDNTISLSWSASTDNVGVAGYKVYRRVGLGGDYLNIAYATNLNYTDSGLSPGTYYYRVSAYDFGSPPNESNLSNTRSATIPP